MKFSQGKGSQDISLLNRHMDIFEEKVGKVTGISVVPGGLVNHVYRVGGEQGTIYVKVRKTEFSALPHLRINPADIRDESVALDILSSAFPEVFPRQFAFYPEDSMIVMSNAIGAGSRLDEVLRNREFSDTDAAKLGALIGKIHARFKDMDISIREDGDLEYYTRNLEYRLGYHRNPELDSLISRLGTEPRQLILGDLSPKNIGIDENGEFTIWDLEIAHKGNTVFDLGFLAAHIILHNIGNSGSATKLINALFEGYYSTAGRKDINEIDLKQMTLGIILFRTRNNVIPYTLDVSVEDRHQISETVSLLLSQRDPLWLDVVRYKI